jgi:HlyD family secretion protein
VAQAEAALRSTEQRLQDARRDAERARALFDGGAVSRQAMEKAETAAEVAAASRDQAREALELVREGPRAETIQAQRAQVDQAQAQLSRAESTLTDAVIRAPFAGVVTVRHREPGETVSPGAPVLTLLDPDDRWVRIYVPENQIGRVRIGQTADIRSDTWPDRTYHGQVVFIASQAEFTPRNVQTQEERTKLVYAVKVRITGDADFQLKPGIPADVTLLESEEG